jgi:hypothetical protein
LRILNLKEQQQVSRQRDDFDESDDEANFDPYMNQIKVPAWQHSA